MDASGVEECIVHLPFFALHAESELMALMEPLRS
jgi:hypothetical protein